MTRLSSFPQPSAGLEESPVILEAERLSKYYRDRQAVRGVSFRIRAGEIFGLLGPNGAGKTTTIGMVATIVPLSGGEVRIRGLRAESAKHKLGLVPQKLCLYPSLTAEENLAFLGRVYGLGRFDRHKRIEALLELTGLGDRRRDRVANFSGGMQRRLNLACGIVHEPDLLLLDEPTVGVDPQTRERIFDAVKELAAGGMAILYTTHYMEEAERLCHRLAIMDEGRFIAEGTVEELAHLTGGRSSVVVTFGSTPTETVLARMREQGAKQAGPDQFQMFGDSVEELVADLLHLVSSTNTPLGDLTVHRPTLGEVFFQLTGKKLRD